MAQARILVIDDEAKMLHTVERVLSTSYTVATVQDPADAVARMGEFQPDLAIIDIRMPEIDGFELMGRLRDVRPDLDVIFMTGVTHELDAQIIRSIREKAFYFIQKPFDREVLLTIVKRCLELRRLDRENREYVRRLEDELEEARSFQRSLLPASEGQVEGVSIAGLYEPCEALGGDLYDYVRAGKGCATVLIADASGHGVSAAMLTGIVKSAFHDALDSGFEPRAVVQRVSNSTRALDDGRFVTLFCARFDLDRGTVQYINAGHPAPIVWGPGREMTLLPATGPVISPALPDVDWDHAEIQFSPGDQLLAYTDGIPEARGDKGYFGEDRLHDLVRNGGAPGRPHLKAILDVVSAFCGARRREDDWTMLTVWRPPA